MKDNPDNGFRVLLEFEMSNSMSLRHSFLFALLVMFSVVNAQTKSSQLAQLVESPSDVVDSLNHVLENAESRRQVAQVLYEISWELKDNDLEVAKTYVDSCLEIQNGHEWLELRSQAFSLKGLISRRLGDIPSALKLGNDAVEIAREVGPVKNLADALTQLGATYGDAGEYTVALELYDEALKIAEDNGLNFQLMTVHNNRAVALKYLGRIDEALTSYFKSLEIAGELNETNAKALAHLNLGALYGQMGDLDAAVEHTLTCKTLYEASGNKKGIADALNSLGSASYLKGDMDQAFLFLTESIEVMKEIGNVHGMSSCMNNISGILAAQGNMAESISWLQKALDLNRANNDPRATSLALGNLGIMYLHLKEYATSEAYADSALILAKELGLKEGLVHVYHNKYSVNFEQGNFKEALVNYELMTNYRDSILTEEASDKLAELKVKYEVQIKDDQMELLASQAEIDDLELDRQNYLIFALSAVLLSIIFLVTLLVIRTRFKTKRRQQELLRLKAELEHKILRAQMNPHFIFNSLNAIQEMYITGETDVANDYMSDFAQLMRRILDITAKNKISIKEELDTLRLYLEMEKLRVGDKFDYTIEVDEQIDQHGTLMLPMIFQPFVENAIWHGILPSKQRGFITISMRLNSNTIVCEIVDDGVGFEFHEKSANELDKAGKHQSKGITLTKTRLEGPVEISRTDKKTIVKFLIPV